MPTITWRHTQEGSTATLQVYCSLVRSMLEYASEVWHSGLTQEQSDKVEHIQKRATRLIFPNEDYETSCNWNAIESIRERRELKSKKLFENMKKQGHKLHHLLPTPTSKRPLREGSIRTYKLPAKITKCFSNSPVNVAFGLSNNLCTLATIYTCASQCVIYYILGAYI